MAIEDTADEGAANATEISITQKMMSATIGSVLTSLLVTPLDVVRVRLQSQHHTAPSPRARSVASTLPITNIPATTFSKLPSDLGISSCCREVFWINNNAHYCVAGPTIAPTTPANIPCAADEIRKRHITGTLDGLRKIARHEGPKTLWRGMSPTLAMAIPANVIYFAGYDWLRTSEASPICMTVSDTYAPLVAGSVARMLAAIAVGPLEMFRTRMQAANHSNTTTGVFRETLNGLEEMVQAHGVRSLWRGLGLTLWRDVPFSAIYWWGYESARNALTDMRGRAEAKRDGIEFSSGARTERIRRRSQSRGQEGHTDTLVDSFVAGAASGAVAAFVTTPFDVGKTRQQILQHSADTAHKALRPEEQSMPRFLMHIFKEQGMSGLFRGWAARCLKVAPACAIMISTYEVGKKMAGTANELRDRKRIEA